jgi:hypothetical protein
MLMVFANLVALVCFLGIYVFVFLEIAKCYIREDRSDVVKANPVPFEVALGISLTGLVAILFGGSEQVTSSWWWFAGYTLLSWYTLRLILKRYISWVYPGTTFTTWYQVTPKLLGTKRELPTGLHWLHLFT